MTNELVVIEKETQISEETSLALKREFMPLFEAAQEWKAKAGSIVVTSEDQVAEMNLAREARLELKKIRCEAENKRKELKAESLRKGKAIDGMANIIKYLVVPIEEHLQKQEDFVKVKLENERMARLNERTEKLLAFGVDLTMYNLADMTEDSFQSLVITLEKQKEEAKQAELKAQQERIEKEKKEAEERERMRKENEQLKKEAEEREKAEKERLAREAKEKVERDAALLKERQEQEASLKKEREEREKAEAELRAKKQAEEKARNEEEEKQRKLAQAPDKERILLWVKSIESIPYPEVKSPKAKEILTFSLGVIFRELGDIKTNAQNL